MSKPVTKQSQVAGTIGLDAPNVDPNQITQSITGINQADEYLANLTNEYVSGLNELGQSINLSAGMAGSQVQNPMSQQVPPLLEALQGSIGQAQTTVSTTLNELQGVVSSSMEAARAAAQSAENMQAAARTKAYNFKKAQMDQAGLAPPQQMPAMGQDTMGFGPFNDASELLQNLEGMDRVDAENKILSYVNEPASQEQIRKGMEMVFEHDLTDQQQLEVVSQLWDLLPDALKTNSEDLIPVEGTLVQNQEQQTMANLEKIKKMVEASNEEIKKLAEADSKKIYNFKKEAQHHTDQNVILWGPESRRIDPFTGEPISDWHVFERNRGWGFRIGDRWDIDFESFWRQNIMDKYHRPYRDHETGDWKGGYVEKRFEVDRWQPDENKYLLKPEEKRKPRPAELGNYEARMEAYRGNEKDVYNWAEANSKKMIKVAGGQKLPPIDPNEYPKIPGLEGPFRRKSGKILYYDPKEGEYYDLKSDMYIPTEDLLWHDSFGSKASSTKKKSISAYNHLKDKAVKTALTPLPEKDRKAPGQLQLEKAKGGEDINVEPQKFCNICGTQLDPHAGQCHNCSNVDSKNFLEGDPKTKRDEKKYNPQPNVGPRNVPIVAVNLKNKEKDDPKVYDKKKGKHVDQFPKLTEHGWNTVEENNMLEPVEKAFSDPDDPENSDKNHMRAVEQTWADLCGDE